MHEVIIIHTITKIYHYSNIINNPNLKNISIISPVTVII